MTRERYIRTIPSIIRQGAVGHHSRRWAAAIAHRGSEFGVSLLMAYQCAEEEAVAEAHEHEVAHAD